MSSSQARNHGPGTAESISLQRLSAPRLPGPVRIDHRERLGRASRAFRGAELCSAAPREKNRARRSIPGADATAGAAVVRDGTLALWRRR